jgi:hypothetical protein
MVLVPLLSCATETDPGEAESVKLGAAAVIVYVEEATALLV